MAGVADDPDRRLRRIDRDQSVLEPFDDVVVDRAGLEGYGVPGFVNAELQDADVAAVVVAEVVDHLRRVFEQGGVEVVRVGGSGRQSRCGQDEGRDAEPDGPPRMRADVTGRPDSWGTSHIAWQRIAVQ